MFQGILEQPVWLHLGCLFRYQFFICLAFCAVLLANLAMEHWTRRGTPKNFHLPPELWHVSRGLRVCLPPSFMMGLWFQLSLQTDILSLFRKCNPENPYQALMIAYAVCSWNGRVAASGADKHRSSVTWKEICSSPSSVFLVPLHRIHPKQECLKRTLQPSFFISSLVKFKSSDSSLQTFGMLRRYDRPNLWRTR